MKHLTVALMLLSVAVGLFSGYLFYFGACEMVEAYWFLTHVPGRCL